MNATFENIQSAYIHTVYELKLPQEYVLMENRQDTNMKIGDYRAEYAKQPFNEMQLHHFSVFVKSPSVALISAHFIDIGCLGVGA